MAAIITPEITDAMGRYCRAFASRWFLQPPEFTDRSAIGRGDWEHAFGDFYRRSYAGIPFPADTPWFARLIREGTEDDLAAFKAAFWNAEGSDSYSKAMHSYLMHNLIRRAWAADQNEEDVAVAIPEWFRAQGWGLPPNWYCELKFAALTPLGPAWLEQKGYANEAEAEAALDARVAAEKAAVAASVPPPSPVGARALPGDDEPPPAAIPLANGGGGAATPPAATPELPEPIWRQGSVGESGPFIGLGYGHTIELAARIAVEEAISRGSGRRRAFELLATMLKEMPEEPDVLSYPDDAIIDGMAWYSWDPERTRAYIRGLLIDALAFDSITGATLTTLLENPAADGALRPAIAANIQRLRANGGV